MPASDCVAQARSRANARVVGRVVAVRVEPMEAAPRFSARIDDGTGLLDAVFMGRRTVPGIEPGAHLSVEGTVCDGAGVRRIFNPRYELLATA